MGVITNLIRMNTEKKARDVENQTNLYSKLALADDDQLLGMGQDPKQIKPWAWEQLKQLTAKEGGKEGKELAGGQHFKLLQMLSGIGGAMKKLNPAPGAPKPSTPAPLGISADEAEQQRAANASREDQRAAQKKEVIDAQVRKDMVETERSKMKLDEEARQAAIARLESERGGLDPEIYKQLHAELQTGLTIRPVAGVNVASQNEQLAFKNKAEELGKTVEQLTSRERIDAIKEFRTDTKIDPVVKLKPQTPLDKLADAYRAANPNLDEAGARAKAGETMTKAAELKAKGPGAAAGPPMSAAELAPLADAAIKGILPDPSFGLSANNPDRKEYYRVKARLLSGMGVSDAASARAGIKAETGSLVDLTKKRGNLSAFENTAKANLDRFLASAKPVIDSGSPLLNEPLRTALNKVAGSPEVAVYMAARRVALNEISRIVNNPNLVGALSNEARDEVQSILPEDATLNQIYAVTHLLRADMATRIDELDKEIERRRSAVGTAAGGGGGGSAAPPPIVQHSPSTGKYRYSTDGGKTWQAGQPPAQ